MDRNGQNVDNCNIVKKILHSGELWIIIDLGSNVSLHIMFITS